ncbi:hypothetical protein H490_0103970 [Leucobacter sp. UCD-THU]|uniref:hypothetical protein n=1 Tax=Leucobacter sp. UCD-THU TaxID=1292023 RepID=UPI00037016DD|nr:hypothetical protein [Leucobacter sp. UCD-THU]EYT55800.1 hypothetical protein H490_0103970 [Leucobacter sp. UCD-THU]
MGAVQWLTYREAARRVGRSVRTIKRWVKDGMPAGWDDQGRRIMREDVLLAELRRRLDAWPPHQHRVRAAALDGEAAAWM